MAKYLHASYSKKQSIKFPQCAFKIYNNLPSLVTFIIYRSQGDGRCIENLVRKPKGKVLVESRKHDCDDNIKMDLNLI